MRESWIYSDPHNLSDCCSCPFIIINQRAAGPKEQFRAVQSYAIAESCNKFEEDYIRQYCTLGYSLCQAVMNHSLLEIHSLQIRPQVNAESTARGEDEPSANMRIYSKNGPDVEKLNPN